MRRQDPGLRARHWRGRAHLVQLDQRKLQANQQRTTVVRWPSSVSDPAVTRIRMLPVASFCSLGVTLSAMDIYLRCKSRPREKGSSKTASLSMCIHDICLLHLAPGFSPASLVQLPLTPSRNSFSDHNWVLPATPVKPATLLLQHALICREQLIP